MWKRRKEDATTPITGSGNERNSWLSFPRSPPRDTELQSMTAGLQPVLRFTGDTYTATDMFEALELATLRRLKATGLTLTLAKGEG
eukprot:396293-Rhodomonas_salina.4